MTRSPLWLVFSSICAVAGCGGHFFGERVDRAFTLAELDEYGGNLDIAFEGPDLVIELHRALDANYHSTRGDEVCPVLLADEPVLVTANAIVLEQVAEGGFSAADRGVCLPAVYKGAGMAEEVYADGLAVTVQQDDTVWRTGLAPSALPAPEVLVRVCPGRDLSAPDCSEVSVAAGDALTLYEGEAFRPRLVAADPFPAHTPGRAAWRCPADGPPDCALPAIEATGGPVWGLSNGPAQAVDLLVARSVYLGSPSTPARLLAAHDWLVTACDGPHRCLPRFSRAGRPPGELGPLEVGAHILVHLVPAEPGRPGGDCVSDRDCDMPLFCIEGSCDERP